MSTNHQLSTGLVQTVINRVNYLKMIGLLGIFLILRQILSFLSHLHVRHSIENNGLLIETNYGGLVILAVVVITLITVLIITTRSGVLNTDISNNAINNRPTCITP